METSQNEKSFIFWEIDILEINMRLFEKFL